MGATSTHAQASSGINFLTVADTNNIAYAGGPGGEYAGRGSVSYQYAISQTEINTGQYIDYLNTFSVQSIDLAAQLMPGSSGLRFNGLGNPYTYAPGLTHPELAAVEVTWVQAAMFTNWLNNGQTDDPQSLMNGAYDISTMQYNGDGTYSGQATHNPDARYWLPSLDEHLKAGFYDPDKNGEGPGWWDYGHSSDEPPVWGLPGSGDVARGLTLDEIRTFAGPSGNTSNFPLGVYDAASPWGLKDILGGSKEWLEDWSADHRGRQARVSSNLTFGDGLFDHAWYYQSTPPFVSFGFRVATVPTPGSLIPLCMMLSMRRNRRLES